MTFFRKTKEIFEVFRPVVFLQLFSESVTIILTPLLIVMVNLIYILFILNKNKLN